MLAKLAIAAAVSAVAAGLVLVPAAPGVRYEEQLCFGVPPTITGSGTIEGTDGDDVIVGSDGDDSIHGKGGNDRLCGGAGDDKLGGGPGDDQIDGGPGNDDIDGGPGTDTILGGEGDDTIHCGPEQDVADGGPGANTAATSGFEACESVTNVGTGEATAPEPKALKVTLTVGREVPRPRGVRPGASGLFNATLTPTGTGATLTWRLTVKRLTGPATAAHIHLGRPGKAGPVVIPLCGPCSPDAQGTATVAGVSVRRAILSGEAYVNVHTQKNPDGELRGQLHKIAG